MFQKIHTDFSDFLGFRETMRNVVSPCGYARQLVGLPEQGSSEHQWWRDQSQGGIVLFSIFTFVGLGWSSRKSHHVVRSYWCCFFLNVSLKEPLGIADGTYSMDLRWRDGFCFQRVVSTWTDEADPNPIQMNRWSSSVFMPRYSRSWQLATSVNVPTSSSFPVINFPYDSGDPNYQTASSKISLQY